MASINGYDAKELFNLVNDAYYAACELGYEGTDIHLATNIMVAQATGIDLVELIANYECPVPQKLESKIKPKKDDVVTCTTEIFEVTTCTTEKQSYTAKGLGEFFYPHISARRINHLLHEAGLQVPRADDKSYGWMPTKKGEKYTTGYNQFKNGYLQLHWDKYVLDVLPTYVRNTLQ